MLTEAVPRLCRDSRSCCEVSRGSESFTEELMCFNRHTGRSLNTSTHLPSPEGRVDRSGCPARRGSSGSPLPTRTPGHCQEPGMAGARWAGQGCAASTVTRAQGGRVCTGRARPSVLCARPRPARNADRASYLLPDPDPSLAVPPSTEAWTPLPQRAHLCLLAAARALCPGEWALGCRSGSLRKGCRSPQDPATFPPHGQDKGRPSLFPRPRDGRSTSVAVHGP